jgi:hypothetical protein
MIGKGIDGALRRRLDEGRYVVDPGAVAEAMLASGVFVALETGHFLAVLVEDHEPRAGRDVA